MQKIIVMNWQLCNNYMRYKAWFQLNVSVIATNRSYLLARTLLHFASFHKQSSFGLLRGLLYLEACKSRSASGIESEITTFRKSSLFFQLLALLFFFGGQKIFFISRIVSFYRSQSQNIATQASQKSNMCNFVARSQAFVAKAVIACDHWCPYIMRHRTLLRVLLTHV